MLAKLKGLFVEEEGQGMAEYGLILGLIAVVCIVAVVALGDKIKEIFGRVTGGFDKVPAETTTTTP
ncbi:MAG TPA: Flp family type IVb pilin [Bacillales bacterium]|nr:Flp family type IVb pilin [Bacillales bacterium]